YPEYASGHIENSELVPLATLRTAARTWDPTTPLLLVCKSGRRATTALEQLSAAGFTNLSVLPGGMDRWSADGKPVNRLDSRVWSLERQVRAIAGSLVLVSVLLGVFVWHWFLLVTALVGSGLIFAGVSDICMMSTVLGKMPWNRPPRTVNS
ncbi:MAG: rhodanese-like domain-containing protein, partial [Bryocella sp.]